jgi:hypothetical protein
MSTRKGRGASFFFGPLNKLKEKKGGSLSSYFVFREASKTKPIWNYKKLYQQLGGVVVARRMTFS